MTLSLYNVSVRSYLQVLESMEGVLAKAAAHLPERGVSLDGMMDVRFFDDMLPFSFQINSVAHHSAGAIEGAMAGEFRPPHAAPPADFAAAQARLADARMRLLAVKPAEVDALVGKDMVFRLGERTMPFVVEDFILSFSKPNFYFHAATAYDLLRNKGAPLGKRDFLGKMLLKTA
jgi:uncharacterized protein